MQWTILTLLFVALLKIPLILKGLDMLNLLSNNVNVSKVFLQIYSYDFSEFISQYEQVKTGQNKLSPTRHFPIDLMLIHSCLIYHNILLNTDFSITFSAK